MTDHTHHPEDLPVHRAEKLIPKPTAPHPNETNPWSPPIMKPGWGSFVIGLPSRNREFIKIMSLVDREIQKSRDECSVEVSSQP